MKEMCISKETAIVSYYFDDNKVPLVQALAWYHQAVNSLAPGKFKLNFR